MFDYTTTEKLHRLNDRFRRSMAFGGSVMLTTGVACLDSKRKVELLRTFDSYAPDNDPHREHDFGAIDLGAIRYFWKIDYCDLSQTVASPDPAKLAVTHRVLTIMRADEY
jgi:hypothetical protein